jgi:hypothetical protein
MNNITANNYYNFGPNNGVNQRPARVGHLNAVINALNQGGGGGVTWGSITGTLSTQTDLQTALNAKQDTLVSGTNIKTINSTSILGSGNLVVAAGASGVSGAIQFSDGSALANDATNFFWNNTAKTLLLTTPTNGTATSNNVLSLTAVNTLGSGTLTFYKSFGNMSIASTGGIGIAAAGIMSISTASYIDPVNIGGSYVTINAGSLGVNVASPTSKLHVKGSGATSATSSMLVQNSSNSQTLSVRDDGVVFVGLGGLAVGSAKFQVKDQSDNVCISVAQSDILFGNSAVLRSNDGIMYPTGNITFRNGNPNSAVINFGDSEVNSVSATGNFSFIKFTRNWTSVAPSLNLSINVQETNNVINMTNGTGTKILRGIYHNPTVTAVTSHRAFESSSGGGYFNTTSVNASAVLQADSTTQGFLMPRMTTTQRDAISTPATGLQIYNTTTNLVNYYNGTVWGASGGGSGVSGAIQFSDGTSLASDATNLFWDDTNNRLGVGTNVPVYPLQVSKTGTGHISFIGSLFGGTRYDGIEIGSTTGGVGFLQSVSGTAQPNPNTFEMYIQPRGGNVGIGISVTPTAKLQVKGSGATNATKSILIQNSTPTETFSISDSGIGLISNSLGINGGVGGSTYLGQTMRLAVNDFSRFGDIRIGGTFASGVGYIQSDATNAIEFSAAQIKFCNGWIASANVLKLGTTLERGRIEINTLANYRGVLIQADAAQVVPLVEFKNSANTVLSYIASKGEFYFGSGTINASAAIQADSTTQGFLPPRMTNAQRAAIVSPAEGLLVHNTTNKGTAYYDGTNWGYLNGAAQTIAGSGGTVNIPFASGNIVDLTLTASTTLTLSGHVVGVYILKVIQGGTGSYTLTYPASVKWSGGTPPTLTTTVGKTDIITLFHDGTNFFGTYSLNY